MTLLDLTLDRPDHRLAAVAVLVVATGAAVFAGRRAEPSRRRRAERAFGLVLLVLWLAFNGWLNRGGRFDPGRTLPLHLCDLAALVAPLALLAPRRILWTLLYFWGLGLSTQAFITPVMTLPPSHPVFWFFWGGHIGIVGAAIYVCAALGYRPRAADFLRASAANLAYAAVVVPLNAALGWNYGFLGRETPPVATALDLLPPWPWRIVALAAVVEAGMALLWLVWPLAARIRARKSWTSRRPSLPCPPPDADSGPGDTKGPAIPERRGDS